MQAALLRCSSLQGSGTSAASPEHTVARHESSSQVAAAQWDDAENGCVRPYNATVWCIKLVSASLCYSWVSLHLELQLLPHYMLFLHLGLLPVPVTYLTTPVSSLEKTNYLQKRWALQCLLPCLFSYLSLYCHWYSPWKPCMSTERSLSSDLWLARRSQANLAISSKVGASCSVTWFLWAQCCFKVQIPSGRDLIARCLAGVISFR